MPLSRSFRETVMARAQRDPEFRAELISEATSAFLSGDIEAGKGLLRDYLNATGSLPNIARTLSKDDKSVRRMLGPNGNPTLKNFIELLHACQQEEHVRFEVRVVHQ
ncbi:MAG: transcriptional regulator [Desulfuromonadales bacterium]|nr:transcriptional regulator [Desulfuromonadales bacterium]